MRQRARDARIWPEYIERVKKYRQEILDAGEGRDSSYIRAYMRAAADFPVLRLEEAKAAWLRQRKAGRKGVNKQKAKVIGAKLPAAKAALLELIAQEDVRQEQLKKEEQTRKNILLAERRLATAKLRRVTVQAQKEEARVEAAKAKARFYYRVKKMKEQQMKELQQREVDKAEARKHGVVVAEPADVDIVRDTQWVYANIAMLVKVNPEKGTRQLNKELLAQAPSNGAIALAMYALEDQKAFMDRFATKLFPKDASKPVAGDDADRAKDELDPGFSDLEQYIGGQS